MKTIKTLFILLLLSFVCTSGPSALTVTDSSNKEFILDSPPKRIVSLVPSITQSLYLMDVQDSIVGVTTFCIYPPQAQKKEKVGTFLNPNVEKILSLSPDIVFATKEGQRKELITKMRNVGLDVFVFGRSRSYEDISRHFLLLGSIMGRHEKTEEILVKADERIRYIRKRLEGSPYPSVFLQLSTRPLMSVGKDTFPDELLRLAGGMNIAGNSPTRYPRFSEEEVMRKDPDVIIIIAMGDDIYKEKKRWQRYGALASVRSGRVFTIDGYNVSTSVPTVFVKGLEEMTRLLHPEVWNEDR